MQPEITKWKCLCLGHSLFSCEKNIHYNLSYSENGGTDFHIWSPNPQTVPIWKRKKVIKLNFYVLHTFLGDELARSNIHSDKFFKAEKRLVSQDYYQRSITKAVSWQKTKDSELTRMILWNPPYRSGILFIWWHHHAIIHFEFSNFADSYSQLRLLF